MSGRLFTLPYLTFTLGKEDGWIGGWMDGWMDGGSEVGRLISCWMGGWLPYLYLR